MKILIIGGGGREHAITWQLTQSKNHEIFITPGNPGTAALGTNLKYGVNDFENIGDYCKNNQIELVIVGPEDPLVNGIYDYFKADNYLKDIHFIGPSKEGALLEGSKAFAKAFMKKHDIPTAAYKEFTVVNYEEGVAYLKQHSLPIVLKADGLAAGKGVVICQSHQEALDEFEAMIQNAKFGYASAKVVVEAFLDGIELSVFVLTNGKEYIELPNAKYYKRIGEKDSGLNTGGMGAVSPVPFADPLFMKKVRERIIEPTIKGLELDQIIYTGFVFIGLIKVNNEPFVIEYNCRMGDPETEVVMPRLKTDLAQLCVAACEGSLSKESIEIDTRTAVTVMAVSGGYPQDFEKGYKINGLDQILDDDSIIFHSGTKAVNDTIVTHGGRVLCVTSFGNNVSESVQKSKHILSKIKFTDMYFRRDIGYEFVD